MAIRHEIADDVAAISDLTKAAFLGKAYAGGNEAQIVEALRAADALTLSLVCAQAGVLIGHVASSPAQVGDADGWQAIGPISVLPEYQAQSVGSALMRAALDQLKASGAKGVVLAGDPAFYTRFGFAAHPGLTSRGIPSEYVLGLALTDEPPSGEIAFHKAFQPT